MEHRHTVRLPANVKILIYKCGLPLAIGWLRNVSREGLFIACDYDNIVPHQLLEIEFIGGRGGCASHKRCRALVTRKMTQGFGLVIDEDCAISCELVEDVLGRCRRRRAAFAAVDDDEETPAELASEG